MDIKCFSIDIPDDAKLIIDTLYKEGYEAFVVGGCVRDSLINKQPTDWDITTSASPQMVIQIFKEIGIRVIETGIKHGTVTILIEGIGYEVTTYRIEGEYENNRRPSKVEFTNCLKEDLKRRDFTINAMAYNDREGLKDYFHGIKDINNKIIRCVGDPNKRFTEDALRMMRAIRFSCQLGFQIEKDSFQEISNLSELINNISKERIKDELCKILVSSNVVHGIENLRETNLLKFIIPELIPCIGFVQKTKYHDKDIYNHTLGVLENTESKLELRLAALFHDIGKPEVFSIDENGQGHFFGHEKVSSKLCKDILQRLKFDNRTIEKVCILVYEHMNRNSSMKTKAIKKFITRVGLDNLQELFQLQIADIKASAYEYQDISPVLKIKEKCHKIISEKQPLCAKDLVVNGKDIIDMGYAPGKNIGIILEKLLDMVLEKPELNDREFLLDYLRKS